MNKLGLPKLCRALKNAVDNKWWCRYFYENLYTNKFKNLEKKQFLEKLCYQTYSKKNNVKNLSFNVWSKIFHIRKCWPRWLHQWVLLNIQRKNKPTLTQGWNFFNKFILFYAFMSLAQLWNQNLTRRVWEKKIIGQFTHEVGYRQK